MIADIAHKVPPTCEIFPAEDVDQLITAYCLFWTGDDDQQYKRLRERVAQLSSAS
ncbi:MAG: hypothetical protein IPK80_15300 [Nannocystis sp.]|nr:hypothetical protein [Nannocystis sp.]